MEKTINTPEEQTLSDKRAGARTVRKAINKKIEELKTLYTSNDNLAGISALHEVEQFIEGMLERDKKRKGGLWN